MAGTTRKEYKFNRAAFMHVLKVILETGAVKSVRYLYLRKKDLAPFGQVKAVRVKGTGEIRINHKYLTDAEQQRIARLNKKSLERKKKK